MIIGMMSDSHGRAAITARAVRALLDAGADCLVHLGDVESEQVIDELVGHNAHVVFGNCDYFVDELTHYAGHVDVKVDHPMGVFHTADKQIAFTHGHRTDLMQHALANGVDYLLHGHVHVLRDERVDRTRVICPGALFRAARYTAALLDPATDELTIIQIPPTAPVQ